MKHADQYKSVDVVERTMLELGYFFLCRRAGELIFRHHKWKDNCGMLDQSIRCTEEGVPALVFDLLVLTLHGDSEPSGDV